MTRQNVAVERVSKLLLACVLIAIQPMYAVVCNFLMFFFYKTMMLLVKFGYDHQIFFFFVFCFSEEGLNSPKNGTRG